MGRLVAALKDERAHNRHLASANERLTRQNDTLRLRLLDLGVDPNEVGEADES
jgi:hypothetical protein